MIRTWIADISPCYNAEVYKKYYDAVPLHRREKADRIRDHRQKAQSIGAWVLYQKACRECEITDGAVFNLSHSGQFALCSIDDSEDKFTKVGCDIEEIKKLHMKLVKRYFLESEKKYILEQSTERAQTEAFYRYWVLKESFMKATRYGMRLGLNTFEILCEKNKDPRLIKKPENIKEEYFYKEYELDIPYKIAVCSTSDCFAGEIQKVRL